MQVEREIAKKRKDYSWPIFLVLVGALLLLNTTNVIGWGIWEYIIRFWPILIVLIGIKIILGNSIVAKVLEILFTLVLTLSVFVVSYIQYREEGVEFLPKHMNDWVLEGGGGMFNLGQESIEQEQSVLLEEYPDITSREFLVSVAAGELYINEDEEVEHLVTKEVYPKVYKAPELLVEESSGSLDITYNGATSKGVYLFSNESEYTLSVGQYLIPSDFDISVDAGSGEVTLQKVLVGDFFAKVAAGRLDVSLSRDSIPTGAVRLNIGAGKLTLALPERVGYSLDYDLGVGKIKVEGREIADITSGRGDYQSSNYAKADIKLDIVVSVGVGSLDIVTN